MPICSKTAGAAVLAALLTMQPTARATDEPVPVLSNAPEVSDSLLAGVRGRYLAAHGIVRFGVQMVSTWQTDTGNTYRASATLNIGLEGKPQVQFVPALSVSENGAATPQTLDRNCVRGAATVTGVSGVVQSIQVAGDGNQVVNDAVITVSSSAKNMPPANATTASPALVAVTPQGARLSSSFDAHGMSVAIEVPQAGRALQQLRAGSTGIVQMSQSAADLQRVQNHLNIFVQTAPGRSSAHDGALSSLRAMHGARLF